VSGIVRVGLGADVAAIMRVFAGDVVPRKKPDPAIYLLAAAELGVEPGRCVVIEDSNIGARAARAAGMRCIVTTSGCAACGFARVAALCFVTCGARAHLCFASAATPATRTSPPRTPCSTASATRVRAACRRGGARECAHGSLTRAAFVLCLALRAWPLLAAGSERFSLHDLTTPGAFWLTPMPPAA
jgi:hypothetical protein